MGSCRAPVEVDERIVHTVSIMQRVITDALAMVAERLDPLLRFLTLITILSRDWDLEVEKLCNVAEPLVQMLSRILCLSNGNIITCCRVIYWDWPVRCSHLAAARPPSVPHRAY